MRRTIGKWAVLRWTVAGVAGALAVAGCGQLQLGAAAIYGNQRITTARLAAEVDNLNAAYQADKARLQLPYPRSEMPARVLGWMLRFATVERLAQRQGIVVTTAQAQQALGIERAQLKQSGDTLRQAAILNGLPPDLIPELGRWIAIQQRLQDRLDHGVPPTSTSAQNQLTAALGHLECLAAKSLSIRVNPQYGTYDYGQSGLSSQADVVPAISALAAGAAPSPAPGGSASPAPHLTPAC